MRLRVDTPEQNRRKKIRDFGLTFPNGIVKEKWDFGSMLPNGIIEKEREIRDFGLTLPNEIVGKYETPG